MKWRWQAALLLIWIAVVSAGVVLFTDVPVWFVAIVLAVWLVWYWFNHEDES